MVAGGLLDKIPFFIIATTLFSYLIWLKFLKKGQGLKPNNADDLLDIILLTVISLCILLAMCLLIFTVMPILFLKLSDEVITKAVPWGVSFYSILLILILALARGEYSKSKNTRFNRETLNNRFLDANIALSLFILVYFVLFLFYSLSDNYKMVAPYLFGFVIVSSLALFISFIAGKVIFRRNRLRDHYLMIGEDINKVKKTIVFVLVTTLIILSIVSPRTDVKDDSEKFFLINNMYYQKGEIHKERFYSINQSGNLGWLSLNYKDIGPLDLIYDVEAVYQQEIRNETYNQSTGIIDFKKHNEPKIKENKLGLKGIFKHEDNEHLVIRFNKKDLSRSRVMAFKLKYKVPYNFTTEEFRINKSYLGCENKKCRIALDFHNNFGIRLDAKDVDLVNYNELNTKIKNCNISKLNFSTWRPDKVVSQEAECNPLWSQCDVGTTSGNDVIIDPEQKMSLRVHRLYLARNDSSRLILTFDC